MKAELILAQIEENAEATIITLKGGAQITITVTEKPEIIPSEDTEGTIILQEAGETRTRTIAIELDEIAAIETAY